MYRCLDENEYLWDGDVIVYNDGDELELSFNTGFRGSRVKKVGGWGTPLVVAVLRKIEEPEVS